MSAPLERIAVVGGGLMGVGVAQVFAAAGHEVTLQDVYDEALDARVSRLCSVPICRSFRARPVPGRRRSRTPSAGSGPPATWSAPPRAPTCRRSCVFEDLALKQSVFERSTPPARSETILLHQHVGHEHHRDRREDGCTRMRVVGTLLEPAVPHPVGRGRPHRGRRAGRGGPSHGPAPARGQAPPHRLQEDVPGCVANRLQHRCGARPFSIVEHGSSPTRRPWTRASASGPALRLRSCGPMENADMVGLDLTLAIPQLHPAAPRWPRARRLRCSRRRWAQATSASRAARGFFDWPAEVR